MKCPHTARIFVPHEDDPELYIDLCRACGKVMDTVRRGDPLGLGDDLGDPEGDEWDELYDELGGFDDLLWEDD